MQMIFSLDKGSEKTINLTHSDKLKNYIWGIIGSVRKSGW